MLRIFFEVESHIYRAPVNKKAAADSTDIFEKLSQ